MAVPYTFGSATTSIPLSQLDSNFATTITLGNTAIQLGNTVTTLNNMTLGNVTISSGTSNLQTNVANATGVLLEANGGTGTTTGYYGFKNRIINGAMVIDQRNAGASVTPTDGQFITDRFQLRCSQASKFTAQQNQGSVTTPVGFLNYLGFTSSSAYSIASGDYFMIRQQIEGFNTADLGWGTANAKTVTLSFQVYSSLTGTFGGSLQNSAANRTYPFTYTITTANTWTSISIIITGDTTGTWVGATNGAGIIFQLGLGVGSTYSGTAGAWAGANYFSATGATSVVGTNGATFYITGVQLEKGSTATSFDYRPYGTELALCQRYFFLSDATAGYAYYGSGYQAAGYQASYYFYYPVPMRTTATITSNGTWSLVNCTGPLTVADLKGHNVYVNVTGTGVYSLRSGSSGYFTFSAEL